MDSRFKRTPILKFRFAASAADLEVSQMGTKFFGKLEQRRSVRVEQML